MSYAVLSAVALLIAIGVAGVLTALTPRDQRASGRALVAAAVSLLMLTAVFDNVIIATGLVGYDSERISGILIGVAPIEDFAYSIAAALVVPTFWQFLTARGSRA